MTGEELLRLAEGVIVLAGIAGVFVAFLKNQTTQATIASQRDLIDTLQKQIGELRTLHIENEKAISELQGQVKVYKELPLSDLAKNMEVMSKTQEQILKLLKKK